MKQKCGVKDCPRDARALGLCDMHYRQSRSPGGLAELNPVGRPSLDQTVWKVRIRNSRGSQPYYFSNREQAHARAEKARAAGELVFFGEYQLVQETL